MQLQKQQNDLVLLPRQIMQHHSNSSPGPTTDVKEAEVDWSYKDPKQCLELTPKKKKSPFHHRGLECKSKKSGDSWSNRHMLNNCLGYSLKVTTSF